MSQELTQAIAYYNANDLTNAKKALKKIKITSFIKSKLEFAILVKEGKDHKIILLGKRLLAESKIPKESVEIANSLAKSYIRLGDAENAEHYFSLSIAQDDSVNNGSAYIHLLKLYALRDHFVNIENLAPKALGWENYSIEAQLLLLESASKFGSKVLVEERLNRLYRDVDRLNNEQYLKLFDYLNAVRMDEMKRSVLDKYNKKFTSIVLSEEVNSLVKNNQLDKAIALLNGNFSPEYAVIWHNLLGNLRHLKGEYSGAFEAWELSAKTRKLQEASVVKDMSIAKNILSEYKKIIPTLKRSPELFKGNEGAKNVFIFGFPRSGTTLLDNVLDTQSDLLVLSERSVFTKAFDGFRKIKKKYPKDIPTLTQAELASIRAKYYEIIESEQGYKLTDSGIVIEKSPHFTEQVPLIKAVFPQSKLIVSIRHPLDVCLSCFQQNFTHNVYNANFVALQDIVTRYIAVFELLERYEEELGIEILYVKYENLVDDLQGEMEKVFSYIGFIPSDDYLGFHQHAKNKFVTSASRGQTSQPIYQSSKYKWKKYEEQLKPYINDLSYFMHKFGY